MTRSPGQRAGLTRDAVLAAADELLAAHGADALTMRAVARRLDVAPNALYSHVANKDALVDGVLDTVLADVELPASGVDPHGGIHRLMTSSHDVLLARPDLVPLFLVRQGARGPYAQRLGEVTLDLLGRAGVTGTAANDALRVLIVHVIGSAAFSASVADEGARPLDTAEAARTFDAGLRWLLAGISRAELG